MYQSIKTSITIGGIFVLLSGCSSAPTSVQSPHSQPPASSILPQAEPSKYVGTFHAVDSGIAYTMRVYEDYVHDSAVSVKITATDQKTSEKKTFSIPVTFHGSNISAFSIKGESGDKTNGELHFGNGVFMIINESYTPFFFEGQRLKFVRSNP